MKKKRLIPVLLLRNGWLVQSKGFSRYQNLGNPVDAVKRLSEWAVDELIYIDISKDSEYDLRRNDIKSSNRQSILEIFNDVSKSSFMPTTIGGKIRTLNDIEERLKAGADKVSINTKPLENLEFIGEAAKEFGSQCIVISMDAKLHEGRHIIMKSNGKIETGFTALDWAKIVEAEGAGEILLNSVDRDGRRNGYDIPLLNSISNTVKIPVIAIGGVGEWEHFEEGLNKTNVDAVAAANIFHYMDQSVFLAKKHLYDKGFNVRNPSLIETKDFLND